MWLTRGTTGRSSERRNPALAGVPREPSAGLEPATPSLPWQSGRVERRRAEGQSACIDAESGTRQKAADNSSVRHPPLPTRYPGRATAKWLGRSLRARAVCGNAPAISWATSCKLARAGQAVASRSRLLEHQRRATHAAALKAPDWGIETDRRSTVVELDDRPVEAGQVPRPDALADADAISNTERREHVARIDRVEQPPACVDRQRNRAEMIVELALGDRVQQRALRGEQRARRRRPVARTAASRAIGHRTGGSPCARTDRLRHDRRRGRSPSRVRSRWRPAIPRAGHACRPVRRRRSGARRVLPSAPTTRPSLRG